MRNLIAAALALLLCSPVAVAQETVHFPSLDGATQLDGYLYRPAGEGRRPAIVGLHGCSGMLSRSSGAIFPIFREWAAELTRQGYVFLLVDSFRPRNHGEMCSILGFELDIYRARPKDAYGALWYLQAQPFVRGDRIGLLGWSQGGGVTLFSIANRSLGRPANLPQGDFRAAVAFYPASCNSERQPSDWTSRIPLLVLMGAEDVWTPAAPCKTFLDSAIGRGAPIETLTYPGALSCFRCAEPTAHGTAELPHPRRGRTDRRHRSGGTAGRAHPRPGLLRALSRSALAARGCAGLPPRGRLPVFPASLNVVRP